MAQVLGKPRVSAEAAGTWQPQGSGSRGGALPGYADAMQGSLLGPAYSDADIGAWLEANHVEGERIDRAALPGRIAELIAAGKVIGLFQGRMEFGPRALGCRSIIADARSTAMQSVLNLKIKFRESFRPFAPAVLRERVADWFELDTESPYMLLVADVAQPHRVPPPPGSEALWGIEKLKVRAVDDSGRDPCRRLGAHPDRAPRGQPALLRHHPRLRRSHRLPGDRQHVVQREGRADRVHA